MRLSRFALPLLLIFFLLPCFLASLPLPPQNPPSDAAEISRDLLFLSPTHTRTSERPMSETSRQVVFLSYRFVYYFGGPPVGVAPPFGKTGWAVAPLPKDAAEPAPVAGHKLSFTLGGQDYSLLGRSDDDRAMLELFRAGASEPFITAVLWNRDQLAAPWLPVLKRQKKGLTAAALQQDLEVADPVIYTVESAGGSVWVAVGHSAGEGELGLGTVVRFDIAEKQASVFQPPELATCDATHLSVAEPDSLLVGTRRSYEKSVEPCAGLVRFHPSARRLERVAPIGSPLENSIVTLLYMNWAATDKGICSVPAGAAATCWRIVPSVTLKSPATVFNKPGEKSGSELKPGDYEVLWANQNFLEIVTKDSYDAWLAADDYAEAAARNFDMEPWKLLNTSTGISPLRPLTKPGGEALEGTLVFRAPLEKLATPQGTPAGWVKVRIHVGWIERGTLEVLPKLIPLEK
jgi:hypothetical protein